MTISSTTNKLQYNGNGVTVAFSFPYLMFAASDLLVTIYDTAIQADIIPPVLNGGGIYDYTFAGTFDADRGEYVSGGDITFNTAPPTGFRITIERVVPQTQGVTLIANSKFPAETVNGALDRLTVLVQRAMQLVGQALYFPSSDPTTVSSVLPDQATRASMYLAFDASGNPIASPGPSSTGGPISAFWATTVQLATAALSRVALNVPGLGDNNALTGNNTFAGTSGFSGTVTMTAKAINEARGTAIASATTTDIGAAVGNFVHITGTTTITGLGTIQAGTRRKVVFDGILLLTHNATSLICLSGASITTAADDVAEFESEGSGNWRMTSYERKDGTPLVGVVNGRIRARVTWTGGGTTITSSSNVTSITRTGAGDYTVNVTTALPAAATWVYGMNDPTDTVVLLFSGGTAPTTTAMRLKSATIAGTPTDAATYWAMAVA